MAMELAVCKFTIVDYSALFGKNGTTTMLAPLVPFTLINTMPMRNVDNGPNTMS